ncbi:hypothetical protein ACP8Y2_00835 [Herpetosiphon llansteffanensis]
MNPFRWLSIGVLSSVLLGCAATVQPTATPVPTAINNSQEAWQQWPVVLTDSFRDNRNKWVGGPLKFPSLTGNLDVGPELYRIRMELKESNIYPSLMDDFLVDREKGFYVGIDTKILVKKESSRGIIFLSQNKNNRSRLAKNASSYFFEINDTYYRLMYIEDEQWEEIIGVTKLPTDLGQEFDRLGVAVKGNTITLFFNDTYLTDIEVDDPLKSGTIGLMCGAYGTNVTQVCEFDNLEVRMPE